MQPKKNKITESTGFWFFLVFIIFLILVVLGFYLAKIYFTNKYYNYQGTNGEYSLGKSKVGNVIFYHITTFFQGKEYIYSFRNHPKDLEDLSFEPDLYNFLKNNKITYVTGDVELGNMTSGTAVLSALSFEQIMTSQEGIYNFNITNTYTTYVRDTLPVITCVNVSSEIGVIYLKLGEESKVYAENKCIIIQGRGGNGLLRASEKFAYSLLGVF